MHSSFHAALGILGLACAGHAGVLFTQTLQDLEGRGPASTHLIRLDHGKVRIDADRNPDGYLIYRGDKHVLWAVDLKAKTYTETTGKDFEAMAAKRDAVLEKLRDQMRDLPDDQKQAMEEMMARVGGSGPGTDFRKAGDGGKVGPWPTEKYEGLRAGMKVTEIWTTKPADIGIPDAELRPLKDMAGMIGKFSKDLAALAGEQGAPLDGLPVKTVAFREGKAYWQSELKDAKREDLPASLFELPAGLTRSKPVQGG